MCILDCLVSVGACKQTEDEQKADNAVRPAITLSLLKVNPSPYPKRNYMNESGHFSQGGFNICVCLQCGTNSPLGVSCFLHLFLLCLKLYVAGFNMIMK